MEEYEINIKSRFSKENWTVTVKKNNGGVGEEETVEDNDLENIEVGRDEIKALDTKKETTNFKVEIINEPNSEKLEENDGIIINQPSKTTIVIQQPDQATTRKIANELNQTAVEGISLWSPTQDFSMVCILGGIEKTDIEKIVQPLVVKIMIESRGDEK